MTTQKAAAQMAAEHGEGSRIVVVRWPWWAGQKAQRRARRLAPGVVAVALGATILSNCGFSGLITAQVATPVPATVTEPAPPTVTPTPTATAAPTPTATLQPSPTATPAVAPTNTPVDATVQQWRSDAQRIAIIDGSLIQLGNQFNGGSLDLQAGAAQLQSLDSQASRVRQSVQGLPALPGADSAALDRYRQTVNQWSAIIHNLASAVANDNIFTAPDLANQLEAVGADLERQGVALHLTGAPVG